MTSDDQPQKPECICGEINARHCEIHQEPDAPPREFWLERKNVAGEFWEAYEWASPGCINVIEKAAYNALAKRVEELEEENLDEMRAHSDECDMHSETNRILAEALAAANDKIELLEYQPVDQLRKNLIDAKAEIERWRKLLDDAHLLQEKLTQAQDRIKFLERQLSLVPLAKGKKLQMVMREQALVAALEKIDKWVLKNVGRMELCRQDLYDVQDIVRGVLKAHKEGAE